MAKHPVWTTEALHDHFEGLFAERNRRFDYEVEVIQAQFAAAKEATAVAALAIERRFDNVNAFRQQLADQTRTYMPRGEAETADQASNTAIGELSRRFDEYVAKERGAGQGSQRTLALVFSILGLTLSLLFVIVVVLIAVL